MGRRQSLVRGNSRREALEIGWNGILLFRKPTKKEKKKKRKKKLQIIKPLNFVLCKNPPKIQISREKSFPSVLFSLSHFVRVEEEEQLPFLSFSISLSDSFSKFIHS